MSLARIGFLVLLSVLLPSVVLATVEVPKVLIRAELPDRPLAEGDGFSIPVDLYIRDDAAVTDLEARADLRSAALGFDSEWSPQAAPRGYRVERHRLTGTLEPGLDRVRFLVTADGEIWEDRIHLRQIGDPTEAPIPVDPAKGSSGPLLDPTLFSRPDPVPSGYPTADPTQAKAPRTVRVHGRLMMRPNDAEPRQGIDGITVYFMQVRDILDDIELRVETTDVNGNFDFNVTVDGTPDLYIKVRALNSVVNVGTDAGFQTYGINFPTRENYAGTDFNLGEVLIGTRMNHPSWIVSTITRAHRWYVANGTTLPSVNVRWIDDVLGSSVYLPIAGLEGIHLRSSATWQSDTVVHEYGHHFVAASPVQEVWPPDYTNSNCGWSHCGWCEETQATAWSEGLPYFLQQEINADHLATYGWAQPNDRTYENLQDCSESEAPGEFPREIELFLAAFLNDLIDAPRDDSIFAPGIFEESELHISDILYVARTSRASNTTAFLDAMRTYLAGGLFTDEQRQEFWAAAAVNGMDADSVPPTPVTSVSSPTHQVGVTSASNLPIMTFFGATDDNSGVDRYRVAIMASAGAPDGTAIDFDEASIAWPTTLAQGSYYINVTVLDRAGNESVHHSHGPIVVGPPDPLDLGLFQPGLWEDAFLVRHSADVTASTGAVEPVLLPNTDLYLSLTTRNLSAGAGLVDPFRHWISLDGVNVVDETYDPGLMTSQQEFQVLNAGPHQLGPGRHYVEIRLDGGHVVPEDDETNNRIGRSLVVRPDILAPGPWQVFGEGPDEYTSFATTQPYPNLAGHRIAPANDYAAVQLATASTRTDYSLQLHTLSTGFDNGFELPITSSHTRDTQVETIFLNTSALGAASFDVGVRKRDVGSLPGYSMRHVSSQSLAPGASTTLPWTDQDDLALLEMTFNALETGPFTVEVDADFDPSDSYPELRLYWMEPGTGTVVPHSTTPDAITDDDGRATLELNVPSTGTYCLAVFRDTRLYGAPQAVDIDITTSTVPQPDLTIFRDNHLWELPFIPHFQPQQGPSLQVPLFLFGESGTFFNFDVLNAGQVAVTDLQVAVDLDGVVGQQFFLSEIPSVGALGTASFYGSTGASVPGGRHTLTVHLDPWNGIQERDESNNLLSMQFGWQGPDLVAGVDVGMAAPPDRYGGSDHLELFVAEGIPGGEEPASLPINYFADNADGFLLPASLAKAQARWVAVGTMPGAASNVDVRLHEVMEAARRFTLPLAESGWGVGESDFVLLDRGAISSRDFDISVVGVEGVEGYNLIPQAAQDLGSSPTVFGPIGIDGGQFLHVYEIDLGPGSHSIKLTPSNGTADLGLSVYPPTAPLEPPFWSKDDGRDRVPMSYTAPAGAQEVVDFEVEYGAEGTHCVVVWKRAAADLPTNEDYELDFSYSPSAPPCVVVDGGIDAAHGPAISVQTTQTAFGDATLGQTDAANGSELDQAFATICDNTLYLTLTGNLETNFNDLEIFLDTRPGGQNQLRGDNADFGGEPTLNRMGDDGTGNGLRFDPFFVPDWWFGVQGGFGDGSVIDFVPFKMMVYQAELLDTGGGIGRFLGATVAASAGILGGHGADNPFGIRATLDNSNTLGVDTGIGAASGAGVTTGIELAIPLEAIGSPAGCVRVTAFLNGQAHDFVSNQVLGPLPPGTDNLGEPRDVDFSAHAGNQYFEVCPAGVTAAEDGPPGLDQVGARLHPAAPTPFNPRTTLSFTLDRAGEVRLQLFDLAGRRIRTLVAERREAGHHAVTWNGRDDRGRGVASGVYVVRLEALGRTQLQRVVLLK